MKIALVTALLLSLAACTDSEAAKKALTGAGYSEIQLTGYSYGCSENDTFSTGFKAKGPTGVRVNGVVCSGVLKGSTIRTN